MILVEDSGFFIRRLQKNWLTICHRCRIQPVWCLWNQRWTREAKCLKKIKELGYAAEMERQDINQLVRWAGTLLSREGKKVTGQTMELFL